jgi:phenylacetate-CoA ligase
MSGIYTNLVSAALFPLHELLKGHKTVAVRRSMEASQWWTLERLRELQLERLQSLVHSVYERVPYYRDLMRKLGFEPQDVKGLEDLNRFPPLTKADLGPNTELSCTDWL